MKEIVFEEITTTLPDETEGVCGGAMNDIALDPRIEIDTMLEVGQWYTLSFWINLHSGNGTGYNIPLQVQDEVQYYPYSVERYWKKFVFTFKAEQESLAVQITGFIINIRIYQVQLEKGKEATAYMSRSNNIAELIADSGKDSEAIKKIKDLCYDNDMTHIDGGKIYTGTITSKQLDVDELFAEDIAVTGDFSIEHMLDDDTKYVFKASDDQYGMVCGRFNRVTKNGISNWQFNSGFYFTEVNGVITTQYLNINLAPFSPNVISLFISLGNEYAISLGCSSDEEYYNKYLNINLDEVTFLNDTKVIMCNGLDVKYGDLTVQDGNLTVKGKPVASDEWHDLEVGSDFKPYVTDVLPRYKRCGDIVYLEGEVSPSASITGSTTQYTICTLPEDCRPSRKVCQLCQGTGVNKWLLVVNTDGRVTFSRYGTNALANATTSVWLPFSVSFMTD